MEVSTNTPFLLLCIVPPGVIGIHSSSMGVTGGCGSTLVGPGFLAPQGSHPASRKLEPYVPVEEPHLDVDCFLKLGA